MCGIVGVVSQAPVNQLIYDALLLLQHRGQDAAGIVTEQGRKFFMHKAKGMVRDVFRTRNMRSLPGHCGLGQVRYPTAGNAYSEEEAQPFYVNAPFGLVLVHNGNLTNAQALKQELFQTDHRHINTDSDSEVLLNVLAHELEKVSRGITLKPADVFAAVRGVHQRIRGSYAVVALIAGHGLLAFRDPYGIRPLCVGRQGDSVMVASESVTLEGNGFELDRDIQPGEALFVAHDGSTQFEQCAEKTSHNPCIFEYVYLARPDSVLDGISVYQARLNLGKTLAKRLVSTVPPNEIDVVIPIPESSRPSAMELAQLLGLPYREGFVKNRYVGRTFIMPGQGVRKKSVRQKLNVIASEFKGRNVLLVDDSIVRGTTSREIVQMARDAGARKVYLASAAPPVRYPNVYGIDMPTSSELVAHDRTVEEVRLSIGCDALIYQDVDAMKQAIGSLNPNLAGFDASCFDGVYVTGDITLETIERMNQGRDQSEEGQEDNSRLALPNAQTA
ncbi:MAG TPA: amidophosphoribosyltransferase [Hydrogenophaga sp.]|jgi:amidophosphoribosyltransferase|uniref:amidophosphoribosyltransferase n=1 Tax=Hydrogenophaga TaxID=47420 RepID=UPI0008C8ECE5|nr:MULTISPECIES: amidophosphoribosyltransferase [Hydrogenophaga]MBU4181920.1 amidophosphoribosyltransferase [Gammaproteobacteria bacterium]MBW8471375.1 amidophosphoribosyltransferase [Thiobacillus sp.]OGA76501.1 MAG: amidophosphoribosyltransferase [Burkholderiales bacterium GWE1_65_30]OGA91417.1 MAG: amidophosphoribosyltransferase [Burkholderiales bacterium GWF1_66_17]OGB17523.1 MAG: amidophosphoribosyltransferase [Burkholderiales bacterium RIFCSPHIGHO2_02_FULL_66_10]OGB35816.1 MAG: amidophos